MLSSNTSQVADGGYQISRSLRFNSADSANLTRTFSSINSRTFTYSLWLKRGKISTRQDILQGTLIFAASDILIAGFVSGSDIVDTTQVFRDPSAWYHIVVAMDTTQATASNRLKLYVNGQQVTAFSYTNYPAQNSLTDLSASGLIGYGNYGSSQYFDGYLADVYFVEGQQLTPSSFGETNAQTGVWQPKAYSGSYGTNGFYLNFSDNSNTTAATLGKDYSGNGNNWTPNNFSVAAGAGNDSLVDTPTPYGSDTGAGGEVRGNYCTLNPLYGSPAPTNGNLDVSLTVQTVYGSMSFSTGKWYWEVTPNSGTGTYIGVMDQNYIATDANWTVTTSAAYVHNGLKYGMGSGSTAYGASYTNGDVIGVALDMDAGTITFYKNGVSQGQAFSGMTGRDWRPMIYASSGTNTYTANFGQRPFAYTAPSGYKALCTQNLPTPTIGATTATQAGKFFNPVLWTANGGVQTITGVGFSPEFLWIKDRQNANSHILQNIVVGASRYLSSDSTNSETLNTNFISSIDADGWSMGSVNYGAGRQLVSWCWKANGSGSSNTAGSITSTVSANTTSGFSIATYTGAAGTGGTVGHGLGVAPRMVIVKCRGANTSTSWAVYHASLGAGNYVLLNSTGASASSTDMWNNTAPTSTVFSVGTLNNWASGSSLDTYVAYCFAEVPGYSRFGSYTGNGSTDGPFVFTGFRPAFILIKNSSATGYWVIFDVARNTYNAMTSQLWPNVSDAENNTYGVLDAVSNGFKLRNTAAGYNDNGSTYIYAAFASNPFKYSLAR